MRIRRAVADDLEQILAIYNQGIQDRIATLEDAPKDMEFAREWFADREDRYAILVAEEGGEVVGWASLNPYSRRSVHAGVADLSVYVRRDRRGKGVGTALLEAIEEVAVRNGFHKIVLFTFPFNEAAQRLYRKKGFRRVGVFRNHGKLDGRFVDVMAMEKILGPGTASPDGGPEAASPARHRLDPPRGRHHPADQPPPTESTAPVA